ncbi:MAG: histidinol dehydrogenase, partial [Anaerolineae bacterium]|nr:histidinol dehydrogenase [Anaerolineae bacterium]
MKVRRLSQMTTDEIAALKRRSGLDIEGLLSSVKPIVEDVRARGDTALLEYTARFDGVRLSAAQLRVSDGEIKQAYEKVSLETLDAFRQSARNVRRFQEQSLPKGMWLTEIVEGVLVGQRVTPIESVGLYVPGGKGDFPSVMLMLGICAQ